jgi:Xaa-Pro aminopeptidase
MMTDPAPRSAAPPRGFTSAEFEARTARAQRLMAAARLDALLLTTEPEVRWFSGFLTEFWQSPTRPWFLVVPATGKPIAVIPEIGAAGMAGTWIDDIRTWPAPVPEDDGVSLLADTLLGLPRRYARLGLAMGPESHVRMPLADLEQLRGRLEPLALADAQSLLRRLRELKSEAEIDKIRRACQIASDAFAAVPGALARDASERTVARAFQRELIERGADGVPYLAVASGPGGYADIIMGPSDRMLERGDVLIIDTGTTFDGYFCDFDRNWAVGSADPAVHRAYHACWQATEAGLAAARPGATAADLWAAMWRVLQAHGAQGSGDVGRMGHGLGMQLTEGHSNRPGDDTVLRPGMVLTLEPGMCFAPGRMMVHEENLVVREDAPELLSRRAPAELPVV